MILTEWCCHGFWWRYSLALQERTHDTNIELTELIQLNMRRLLVQDFYSNKRATFARLLTTWNVDDHQVQSEGGNHYFSTLPAFKIIVTAYGDSLQLPRGEWKVGFCSLRSSTSWTWSYFSINRRWPDHRVASSANIEDCSNVYEPYINQ